MKKRFIVTRSSSFYDEDRFIFPTKREALNKYNELVDKYYLYADLSSVTLVCEELLASNSYDLEDL